MLQFFNENKLMENVQNTICSLDCIHIITSVTLWFLFTRTSRIFSMVICTSLLRHEILVFAFPFRSRRVAATRLHLFRLPVPVFWSGVHVNISDTSYFQLHIDATGVDVLCDWAHHGCRAGRLCPPAP